MNHTMDLDTIVLLVRRVVDATGVTILDGRGRPVASVGRIVDLSSEPRLLDSLRDLPGSLPLPVEHLGGLRPPALAGADWLAIERCGNAAELLIVVTGAGELPDDEGTATLALLLRGARERRQALREVEQLAEAMQREQSDSLLAAIARAQSDFLLDGDPREVFSRLLDDVLALTDSEYGFIGEVETDAHGHPFLRTWAITNIAWTDELRNWFQENNPNGIEFTNLDTLFGEVVRTGRAVIADDPATDPRRGGLPEGHPALNAFCGLPFSQGDRLVGMVGLANRPGGYEPQLVERLDPFLTTCAALIEALRTQRLRQESELLRRENEARTTAILQAVVDAVVVIDQEGRIETFNRSAERIFGHRADEVMGRDVRLLMADADAAGHDASLQRYLETGERRVIGSRREVTGRRKDGSTFPLELSVSEVTVEGRRLFAGTCRDLTDKQNAEQEIRMYAATIEATPDFVGVASVDGRILAINRAGRDMIGLPPDAPLTDIAVGDIHSPWSRDVVRTVGMPTAVRDGVWSGETAFLAPDGREVPMSQVIVVSRNANGEPQLVSTIARDITERKEIERVKSEFVSTVSHELRTPLTSIRGSLGLLAGGVVGELSPRVAEMVQLARDNTDRLIRLVNNILDFEKAQANRLELRPESIDPSEIARTARDAVGGAAIEAGVVVELRLPHEPLPVLRGDADRLVQVLVNLLGNALKFSPQGERVVLSVQHTDGGRIRFAVADRGPGIAAGDLDTIFEPFRQLDSSDRRMVGGTGLGLAIAKSITELHGGQIVVDSEPGAGSTFVVELPVPNGDAPMGNSREPADSARPDVLIAEHDSSVRLAVRRLLEARGLTCAEAVSGPETLRLVDLLSPRSLVMDVGLPVLDAFGVADLLRTRGGHEDLPVIVYTGRDLTPAECDRLRTGVTRFLVMSHPTEDELVDSVCGLLAGREAEVLS